MLQPLQLKDVSVRYVNEIAEMRSFLVKADCAVGTNEALGGIAARLPRDGAFRRDLTLHVWVLIDRCDGQVSYSDLLGVLAVAAAGMSVAAAAGEDDAHKLLRFLMEARRSFDTKTDYGYGNPLTAESAGCSSNELLQSAKDKGPAVWIGLLRPLRFLKVRQNTSAGEKSGYWVVVPLSMILILAIGLWVKLWPVAEVGKKPASVTSTAVGKVASTSATQRSAGSPTARPTGAKATSIVRSLVVPQNSRVMRLSAKMQSSRKTPSTALDLPPRRFEGSPNATAAAAHKPALAQVSAAAIRAGRRAGQLADTLSNSLGAQSVAVDALEKRGSSAFKTSMAPVVLHGRTPGSSIASSQDSANLVSEIPSSDVSAAPETSRMGSINAVHAGIVRHTSLGVMAGNVLYSPVPTYPAAAFASHVQGEVRVSADVDRDGNVASVRVISGPSLLRDATLEAVQRWRYRPFMSFDEPTPMTAISVMEFELQ